MNLEQIDDLARRLVAARTQRSCVSIDPAPPTAADAYRVDDRVCALLGTAVRGWKIGCTSEFAQEVLRSDGPISGRVYDVWSSGVALSGPEFDGTLLEGEVAFTLGADLAPRSQPYSRAEVTEAVATMHAAIEVVGGRSTDFLALPINAVIADAGANTCLVLGDAIAGWRDVDLAGTPATMTVDGTQTGAGTGADVLGHPLDALAWLANHLSDRGIGLTADQVVTTGTCTQVSHAAPGTEAVMRFGAHANARLTIGRVPEDT